MPGAIVGADCNIGDHAFIETGPRVGDRVTVKNSVLLWDKVTVEDDVFLGPNAVFTNDLNPRVAYKNPPDRFLPTVVRRGATIGANATIVCGVTIGEQAFVGAGTVVVEDVPAHALMDRLDRARRCQCAAALRKPRSATRTRATSASSTRRPSTTFLPPRACVGLRRVLASALTNARLTWF